MDLFTHMFPQFIYMCHRNTLNEFSVLKEMLGFHYCIFCHQKVHFPNHYLYCMLTELIVKVEFTSFTIIMFYILNVLHDASTPLGVSAFFCSKNCSSFKILT